MTFQKSHFIKGSWIPGTGPTFHSINPATSQPIWHGHEATSLEINLAIEAAQEAFPSWRNLTLEQRIHYLKEFEKVAKKHADTLAKAISEEVGKPLWEAKTEVQSLINKIGVSIEAYAARCPDLSKADMLAAGATVYTTHRPHGVLAVFGPFNFPAHLPNGHIIPALLAGNTVIFKPSEHAPYVGELYIKLWEEAGLPPGVINLVQGGSESGRLLSSHEGHKGVLFTGSWNVGRQLSQQLASRPYKILALELGGNNPLVVGSVNDFKAAAYHTIQSGFLTSGQRCTCSRRVIVQNRDADAFLDEFVKYTKSLIVGPYTANPEPYLGPLISQKAADDVLKKYHILIDRGAVPIVPMTKLPLGPAFLSPAILDSTNVKDKLDEEIFGPLVQIIRVDSFDDAIEEANNTSYGLSSSLLSDDKKEFELFLNRINAGVINWNLATTGARSNAPFGGTGKSGNNRPSSFYAADYCSYPVASVQYPSLVLPKNPTPGFKG